MLPGAGYLALAIEAITQINRQSDDPVTVESYTLRDVTFSSATFVPEDDTGTETMFRMQPMEGKSPEDMWYEFAASCCSYGSWKETARGRIALNVGGSRCQPRPPTHEGAPLRKTKHIDWLDKLRSIGIDLGPAFHHIDDIYTSDIDHFASGKLLISKECGLMVAESRYLLHPTVIDSCMQPSTATIHRGNLDALRCGTIPTHISEATLFVPSGAQLASRCQLQVWTPPPLGNRAFASHAQLVAHDGSTLLHLAGLRHVYYRAAVPQEMRGPMRRYLYMREEWKMDADYLHASPTVSFESALEALFHKRPQSTRTLCLDPMLIQSVLSIKPEVIITVAAPSQEAKDVLLAQVGDYDNVNVLEIDIDSPRTSSDSASEPEYDLILSSCAGLARRLGIERILNMLARDGNLVIQGWSTACAQELLFSAGPPGILTQTLPDGSMIAKKAPDNAAVEINGKDNNVARPNGNLTKSVLLVHGEKPILSLLDAVCDALEDSGWSIRVQSLTSLDATDSITPIAGPHESVVILDEDPAKGALLAHVDDKQLQGTISLTESAPSIIWMTCGGLLTGDIPEYGMTTGAARVIRGEKGAMLDLVTLDYDIESTSGQRVARLVADILDRQNTGGGLRNGETEYYLRGGVVHIGRLVPHADVNAEFVSDSGVTTTLRRRDETALAMHGRLDQVTGELSYHRDERHRDLEKGIVDLLGPSEVEVNVAAIGLTADDGADDVSFLSHQLVGTVTRTGDEAVKRYPPGSFVGGFASSFNGRLATIQRTSSQLLFPLADGKCTSGGEINMAEAASVPSAFSTAIYGLEELARVEPGETVVIIDGMGAIGLAALQVCHKIGANAIVVTTSKATEGLLVEMGLLGPSCTVVFWGSEEEDGEIDRDGLCSSTNSVSTAVEGGVDVVLCPGSVGETSVLWSIGPWLLPFARIVAIGDVRRESSSGAKRSLLLSSLPNTEGLSFYDVRMKDVAERRPLVLARYVQFPHIELCKEISDTYPLLTTYIRQSPQAVW